MSELSQTVGVPLEPCARICWPKPWIDAAVLAGFAHDRGNGCWVFYSDMMRDRLTQFAVAIAEHSDLATE